MTETVKYKCDKCDYFTSRKYNYVKHIKTDKHKSLLLGDVQKMSIFGPTGPTGPSNNLEHRCPNCDRKYMVQRSLWRHLKQCQSSSKPETVDKAAFDIFKTTITELCKSNAELNKMNQIQHLQMTQMFTAFLEASKNMIVSSQQAEPLTNTTNNHKTVNNLIVHGDMTNTTNNANNTFNMNFFLNEQCKDAMNMSDFVKAIELDSNDMENVGTHGFVKGISNIFMNNLEKTDITKRPIHCSDSKRDVLYIKDDNKWERDSITSQKLIDAVRVVEHKNIVKVNEWAKQHPECENSVTLANDIYFKMSKSATDGIDENVAKVIKRVIQHVVIDKKELANQ
jgi:hypothetical protein